MLNSDLCERCFRELFGSDRNFPVMMVKVCHFWDEGGDVLCAKRYDGRFIRTVDRNASPPEECPYAAEHVVGQDA